MNKIKYPRTLHVPFSEKTGSDDKVLLDMNHLEGKEVVVSIKMDGENTSIYPHTSHARSLDSKPTFEGRNWIEALRLRIQKYIPVNTRLCGENMFHKHTCAYHNLESMFYGFSIWENDFCLSYDETEILFGIMKIPMPPVIYRGVYDGGEILHCFNKYRTKAPFVDSDEKQDDVEGFVIRVADSFLLEDFSTSVCKFVSEDFEVPDEHWMGNLENNKLKSGINPWQYLNGIQY